MSGSFVLVTSPAVLDKVNRNGSQSPLLVRYALSLFPVLFSHLYCSVYSQAPACIAFVYEGMHFFYLKIQEDIQNRKKKGNPNCFYPTKKPTVS